MPTIGGGAGLAGAAVNAVHMWWQTKDLTFFDDGA
jgi:hypothetical protein